MQVKTSEEFEKIWNEIPLDLELSTPDKVCSKPFVVVEHNLDKISVRSNSRNHIVIHKGAFVAVLRFLAEGHHYADRPCLVAASYDLPGTLGYTAKRANINRAVVITYILPVLQQLDIVGIDRGRPNRTWLL